jgi:hypothetical protein
MGTVNKPEVSRILAGFYAGMAVFLAVLFGVVFFFIYTQKPEASLVGIIVLVTTTVFVEGLMLWLLASIHRTRYVLTDSELVLQAPKLIGGSKRIPLEKVESVQRTLIPFGFRLFGASFYGGYYYFPGVGRAFMVITNYRDGVLIKAANGNYVITPSNPDDFIASIKPPKPHHGLL